MPEPGQGEIELRPRPVPKASITSVIAHAVIAPAIMEGQETPAAGEPADPPGATTTVSIIYLLPGLRRRAPSAAIMSMSGGSSRAVELLEGVPIKKLDVEDIEDGGPDELASET